MRWLPFQVRRWPYGPGEEPREIMIELLSKVAASEGKPLADGQKELLRREVKWKTRLPEDVPESTHGRMHDLVTKTIEQEIGDGSASSPRSFCGAVEWAGDQAHPYVVQLAESALCDREHLIPLTGWRRVKDRLWLVGSALVMVALMALLVGLLGLFGVLK